MASAKADKPLTQADVYSESAVMPSGGTKTATTHHNLNAKRRIEMDITAWEIAKQCEARAGFLLSQSFISDFSKYRLQLQLRIEEEAKDWALHAKLMREIDRGVDNEG